jgi:TldD protein
VLAEIKAHQVDEADLYFQYTRSEGWSLEEGIVKTGSFSIDQGVGVRAVSGEKTAFAYSDDISQAALLDAARTVRSIGLARTSARSKVGSPKVARSRALYSPTDPISTLDSATKVALLGKVETLARAKDPRVVQVMAGLAMRIRRGDGGAGRWCACRRCAPTGAPVGHGDCRTKRPPRKWLLWRRGPLRPGLL